MTSWFFFSNGTNVDFVCHHFHWECILNWSLIGQYEQKGWWQQANPVSVCKCMNSSPKNENSVTLMVHKNIPGVSPKQLIASWKVKWACLASSQSKEGLRELFWWPDNEIPDWLEKTFFTHSTVVQTCAPTSDGVTLWALAATVKKEGVNA